MKSFKDKYCEWKINRKYKKFKNSTLPYPFWDKKRETFEWVYYDKLGLDGFDIQTSLYEALGNVARSGVVYHYGANMYGYKNSRQKEATYQLMESHCHSFEELIRRLYDSPESFYIPRKYLAEYSKQELYYINKIQSYLKAIGLKDDLDNSEIMELNKRCQKIDNKEKKIFLIDCFFFTILKNGNI